MAKETTYRQCGPDRAKTPETKPRREKSNSSPLRTPLARRALLTGASAAAAGAAFATIAAEGQEETAEQEAASDPRRLSYRETDHIRQFYARARF